jgi:RNA polymerase sigma-32 factor
MSEPGRKTLSRAEERALVLAGNMDAVVVAHLPLVYGIASRYARAGRTAVDDLVQQGCLGLVQAAKRFEIERGNRFLTYATPWVHMQIRRYLEAGLRMVRVGLCGEQRTAIRLVRIGQAKSVDDLVTMTGMSRPMAERMWPMLSLPDARFERWNEDGELREWIPSESASPEEQYGEAEKRHQVLAAVRDVIAALPARERDIVELRWMADEPATLEALGERHGVSRERVRQVEVEVKKKFVKALRAQEARA